jgi:DnaJ family protein C protein 11/ATP-dependent RNA helicase DDX10/DBP4
VRFHPDKHQDELDREAATKTFNRIQKAYEGNADPALWLHSNLRPLVTPNGLPPVLTDGDRRAVYDEYGIKGLEAGMEVSVRNTGSVREVCMACHACGAPPGG